MSMVYVVTYPVWESGGHGEGGTNHTGLCKQAGLFKTKVAAQRWIDSHKKDFWGGGDFVVSELPINPSYE